MSNVVRHSRYVKSCVDHNNNKFWYITERDDATVFVEWGRVGYDGQNKVHTFGSQGDASSFFDSKCREKERAKSNGEPPYRSIQVMDAPAGNKTAVLKGNHLETVAVAQIAGENKQLQALIRELAQANVHNILSSTTLQYDNATGLFSTPVGIVTQDGIDEARKILVKIGDFVNRRSFTSPSYIKSLEDYLMLIPQNVGMKLNPQTIYPDLQAVQKQNDILDSLQASLSFVVKQASGKQASKPVETVFQVELVQVDDKKVVQAIQKKYESTRSHGHQSRNLDVKKVYTLTIKKMAEAFAKDGKGMSNIMELWHGTRIGNVLSIMKHGLVIPSSSASHCTGRLFGNGLYFSDISTKSLNYATGYWSGSKENRCFMFVADVAMGNYCVPRYEQQALPAGHDSFFAKPGKSGIQNNEMIVFRLGQVNLKYLVEFG